MIAYNMQSFCPNKYYTNMKRLELQPAPNIQTAAPSKVNEAVRDIDVLIPEDYRDNIPLYLERIMLASSMGSFNMSAQQYASLTALFNKKVAPAPRQIDLNSSVKIEHTIKAFLSENEGKLNNTLLSLPSAIKEESEITDLLLHDGYEIEEDVPT